MKIENATDSELSSALENTPDKDLLIGRWFLTGRLMVPSEAEKPELWGGLAQIQEIIRRRIAAVEASTWGDRVVAFHKPHWQHTDTDSVLWYRQKVTDMLDTLEINDEYDALCREIAQEMLTAADGLLEHRTH